MELLDKTIKIKLEAFMDDINKILSDTIIQGFDAIEALINIDSFLEAEQGMKNLSRVQRELAAYCTSTALIEKSKELRERLDGIVNEILQRDFEDINTYSMNSPKDLITKLRIIALRGNARFNQVYNIMLGKIRQNFSTAIEQVRAAALEERVNKEIDSKLKDILPFKVDIDKLEEELKKKIQKLGAQLLAIASKSELSSRDSDQFRMFYNHLASLDKYTARIGFDARQFLDASEEKIFDQVMSLSKEIRSSSSDVPKVAKLLTKMKFFAENLSMFDNKINEEIDEILKIYKQQEGPAVLMQLTMILEKTDIGARLISEHSSLSGEDWRRRREKMQNQDNLEYVLKELAGDDITTDVLATCYQTFRATYDDLISRILGVFDQKKDNEPDLEVLINQTKALVATVTKKPNTIIWDHSFKDKIPELLAHIFAVWTLKNTQHYNALRGIESARAYLLMPHVAQVLAIFRILGIGYNKYTKIKGSNKSLAEKISDDLINNLVEIGTGEGKSVVMAVTACVFALLGVDVNCSCYSEVLSARDKKDFASVFRALGVEERIEYGTFNKLITLLTRTFGRGTDFICRNQQLLLNGGMHVLQTFFSEELSEEYQIIGRGARQGDYGSYRMILLDKDLEWVLGPNWKTELPKILGTTLYAALNKARNAIYESKCAAKELGIEQCKHEHNASKEFMTALSEGNMKTVKNFLLEQNRGASSVPKTSRTVLLMDATGSMSNLLSATKETVCTMFERASDILKEKMLPSDAFQMQIAIYRNYNSKANKILQTSSWETKASNLRAFMNTIHPEGGWGNEAIEIGLWHAVKESEMQNSISQVILIGDAPANTQKEVSQKRGSFGEAYWEKTRFSKPTYYQYELQKLKENSIPVHAFYLTDYAKGDFRKIARETQGRCEHLDIYSSDGAESLTDFVTEEILRSAAGDQGDAAVELYKMKYERKTYAF
ncbi:unnamed protein product [Rotaria sp. Silwood1]|nr:unnamed protein product [Rotaria sp. Silwood1]CAF4761347.1 unnamed protein product [Rotaria sp. Silwood1]